MHDAAVVELLIATSGHMQPWNGRLNWKNSRVITSVRRPSPESRTGSRAWLPCSLGMALLHDLTAARVGALFQLLVQDTTAQDFGLPSSAIRLRM